MKHQQVNNNYQIILYFFKLYIVGACAHLTSFYRTDTISGCVLARNYYLAKEIAAYSIPGTDHSAMISWTCKRERDAYENILGKDKLRFKTFLVVY